ncbi:hypothetical protein [Sphingomonas sp. C3-2]|uniref:hypothetical protein n=1 Tax=Sphingomonas sp. C3-2 TaxID=3062169 RepID=UPI00294B58E0|nr:hypothetical protein [Sphingomonas sp. C3-2]WOK35913.1 hypothetical protein QYC26_13000 [Sphingomonas sp. C3-2]
MKQVFGRSLAVIGVGALALGGAPLNAFPIAWPAPTAPLPAIGAGLGDVASAAQRPKRPAGGGGHVSRPPGGGGGHARPPGGGHASRPGGGHHGGGPSHGRPPARGSANININHNYNGDSHYHGRHDHWDDDWDDHWHPVRTAATVAVTAAVVGSIVRSIPPNCSSVMVNGINYSQCGNTWYQPQYAGSSVQYVVVNPPR